MTSWAILIAATVLDVAATIFMKQSQGFSKLLPAVLAVSFFAASILGLAIALKTLDVIPVYVVWVGLGTALITVLGVLVFHEIMNPLKLVSVLLVMFGVAGLTIGSEPGY